METLQYGLFNQVVLLSEKSMEERLESASLNTLLGMGIVFSVLILISILISFFKIIPYLQQKKANDKVDTGSLVDQVIEQISRQEEEELMDDYELVAVITAAIQASMAEALPANGFVVRSIRKTNYGRKANA
ncbi:OadG family protein [Mobilitalea sibirica]|uniref:OadG family protein n=1 Tax=Mobilitalea sibirica TaxID=1462919 RepID=A0A8J7L0H4_9FIRM|nr:OadG family protein [Mobilitalea sibirica]MBH1942393.1 OadG family protein [Mobilitalea sibirica]